MELKRSNKLLIGLAAVCLLLLGKLFYIQIINDSYKRDASNNSMVYRTIYPPRGLIYDRNMKPLVTNKTSYDIMVTPREVQAFDTVLLARVLDTSVTYIRERMQYYRTYRSRIGYQTLTFLKQVGEVNYMQFAEMQYKFPGFSGQVRTIREYPFDAGGNLLGYVSEVDADFLKRHPEGYKAGDYAGKTGLEAAREEDLRGEKGYNIFLRDSRNRVQDVYEEGRLDKDAVPGKNIVTTIDAELQMYGQQLMKGKVGSVVAIEPGTGEILAMVSSPGISVDQLAEIGRYYNDIVRDPLKPMFNRTVQASYPPGSVFKLVNGLIGLQEGVLQPSYEYPCHAGYSYTATRKLGCHNHRSPLDLTEAIMMSCNAYFCYVLRNTLENRKYERIQESYAVWREYVTSFGFGSRLGSDFPSELGGNIPDTTYYNRIYGTRGWRFPTIVSLSIGQGEIGVTPLQIANLSAIVANRGFYYIPHLVKDSEGIEIDPKYKERIYTKVDTAQFAKVIPGMYLAVNSKPGAGGTATVAAVPGLDICGKTGTAQNPHGKDNSVFICFAPMDNPRIAIAAYVENAGFGATWASPIASLMVERYLNGKVDRPELENRIMNAVLTP